MSEAPGKLLSTLSDGHNQSATSKKGGYMGALFQLFDRNIKSSKKHSISKALPQPGKEFHDDKLPMAKLLLIADENRGGFPSPKKIAASKELSDRGTNNRFPENGAQKHAPGVVARLMGLEPFPDKKLCKDEEDVLKQMDSLELRPLQELLHHKQEPFVLSDKLHESQAEKVRRQSLIGKFSVFVKKPLDKIQHKQSHVITDGELFKTLTLQDPLASSSDLKTLQNPVLLPKQLAKEPSNKDSYHYISSPHLTPLQIQSIFNRDVSTSTLSKSNSPSESPPMSSNFLLQRGTKLVGPRILPSSHLCVAGLEPLTGSAVPCKDSESESDSIRTTETLECRKRVKHSHVNVGSNVSKLLKGQSLNKSWNGVEETNIRKFHPERTPQETPRGRASSHHPMKSLQENKHERKNSSHRDVGNIRDHTRPSQPKTFPRRYSADKQDSKKGDSACIAAKTTASLNQFESTKPGLIKSHNTLDGNAKHMRALSSVGQDSLKRCKSVREGASTAPLPKFSLVRSKSGKEGDGFSRHTMLHQDVQQICVQEAKTDPEQMTTELLEKPSHDTFHGPFVEQETATLVEKKQVLPNTKDLPTGHSLGLEKECKSRVNLKEKMQAVPKPLASSLSSKQPNLSNTSRKKITAVCNKSFDPGQLQRLTKRKQSTNAEEDHKRNKLCAVKSLSRRRVTPDPCVPNTKVSSGNKNGKAWTASIVSKGHEGGRVPLGTLIGDRNLTQSKPAKVRTEQKVNVDESQKIRPKRQLPPKKLIRNGIPPSDLNKNKKTGNINSMKEKMDVKETKDTQSLVVARTGITVKGEECKENLNVHHTKDPDAGSVKELTRPREKLDDSANFLGSEMLESNKVLMQGKMLEKHSSTSYPAVSCTEESIELHCGDALEEFDNLFNPWDTCDSVTSVTSDERPIACHSSASSQELHNISSIELCVFREQLTGALHENGCTEVVSPAHQQDNTRHELKGIGSSGLDPNKGKDCLGGSCQPSPISVLDIPFQDESPKTSDDHKVSRNEELEHFQEKVPSNSSASALKVRENAAISTTEDFIQNERIMEAILGISRIRHIDPCSLGIKEAIDMACAEDEVRYMHDILSTSEFLWEEDKFMDSPAQGIPIDASVFENLENQDNTPEFSHSDEDDEGFISLLASKRSRSSFLQRKLLFDCFNEALSLELRSLWSDDPLAGKLLVKGRQLSGKELINEIHRQICQWRELAGSMTDELVQNDMNSGTGKWTDVKQEVTEIGLDVERIIFKTVIEEIISEMIE